MPAQTHQLSSQQVATLSLRLGINPNKDFDLAWIVEEFLKASLPAGWRIVKPKPGVTLFMNTISRVETTENPIEPRFKELVRHIKEQRREGLPVDELTVYELLEPIERPADVADMAQYMNINLQTEPYLLWIAKLAVLETIPEGWVERSSDDGSVIYCNMETGETSVEHPSDALFQKLLERERGKRPPYLSIQPAAFANPLVHFRKDQTDYGQTLRIQVLPNSGPWLDFYDAYGFRFWYHMEQHIVANDLDEVRRIPAATTIQRIWRGYLDRCVLYDWHFASLKIGQWWRGILYQRSLVVTNAKRFDAVLFLQRAWRRYRAQIVHSHTCFMRLCEFGQRTGLARRRRQLTAGLQQTGHSFPRVRRGVVLIQRSWRDVLNRRLLVDESGERTRAAIVIQRAVRVFQAQIMEAVQRTLLEREQKIEAAIRQKEDNAAAAIQSLFRGMQTRQRLAEERAAREAAVWSVEDSDFPQPEEAPPDIPLPPPFKDFAPEDFDQEQEDHFIAPPPPPLDHHHHHQQEDGDVHSETDVAVPPPDGSSDPYFEPGQEEVEKAVEHRVSLHSDEEEEELDMHHHHRHHQQLGSMDGPLMGSPRSQAGVSSTSLGHMLHTPQPPPPPLDVLPPPLPPPDVTPPPFSPPPLDQEHPSLPPGDHMLHTRYSHSSFEERAAEAPAAALQRGEARDDQGQGQKQHRISQEYRKVHFADEDEMVKDVKAAVHPEVTARPAAAAVAKDKNPKGFGLRALLALTTPSDPEPSASNTSSVFPNIAATTASASTAAATKPKSKARPASGKARPSSGKPSSSSSSTKAPSSERVRSAGSTRPPTSSSTSASDYATAPGPTPKPVPVQSRKAAVSDQQKTSSLRPVSPVRVPSSSSSSSSKGEFSVPYPEREKKEASVAPSSSVVLRYAPPMEDLSSSSSQEAVPPPSALSTSIAPPQGYLAPVDEHAPVPQQDLEISRARRKSTYEAPVPAGPTPSAPPETINSGGVERGAPRSKGKKKAPAGGDLGGRGPNTGVEIVVHTGDTPHSSRPSSGRNTPQHKGGGSSRPTSGRPSRPASGRPSRPMSGSATPPTSQQSLAPRPASPTPGKPRPASAATKPQSVAELKQPAPEDLHIATADLLRNALRGAALGMKTASTAVVAANKFTSNTQANDALLPEIPKRASSASKIKQKANSNVLLNAYAGRDPLNNVLKTATKTRVGSDKQLNQLDTGVQYGSSEDLGKMPVQSIPTDSINVTSSTDEIGDLLRSAVAQQPPQSPSKPRAASARPRR